MAEKGYKKLIVWQKAEDMAFAIYTKTKSFPKEEVYGLTAQLRRAALSVPTNIAEAMGRQNKNETRQFVNVALGSLTEVESLLGFSRRLEYLSDKEFAELEKSREQVGQLLWGLYRSLK